MHASGALTRVTADGEEVALTRPNALVTITPGAPPDYRGVASEIDVAQLYANGPVRDGPRAPDGATVELAALRSPTTGAGCRRGAAGRNDESCEQPAGARADPGVTNLPRLPGLGSTPALIPTTDDDAGAALPARRQGDGVTAPGEGSFAPAAVGGVLFTPRGATSFVDGGGLVVADPGSRGLLISQASIASEPFNGFLFPDTRLTVAFNGGFEPLSFTLPPENAAGIFAFTAAGTGGGASGFGFVDYASQVVFAQGAPVEDPSAPFAFVGGLADLTSEPFGLVPGAERFTMSNFSLFPDFADGDPTSGAYAFLPTGVGEAFAGQGGQFFGLITPPGVTLRDAEAGRPTGARWLFTQFALNGEGEDQRHLLAVGAGAAIGGGDGGPRMNISADGSFRLDAAGPAQDLARPLSLAGFEVANVNQPRTVFGFFNDYLVLTQATSDGDGQVLASTTSDPATGQTSPFGGVHLAHFEGAATIGDDRISIGLDAADYAARTGLSGRAGAKYLTGGYASAAGFASGPALGASEAFLLRSERGDTGVRAAFDRASPEASLVLTLDASPTGGAVRGARVAFGGATGAVADQSTFGLGAHPAAATLSGEFVAANEAAGFVMGDAGRVSTERSFRGALLSHSLADVSGVFPSGAPLAPKYLTGGWWTGAQKTPGNASGPLRDAGLQYSLGAWVAGVRSVTLPTTGVATFDGAVALNVIDPSGADYVDGGRFRLAYDFGAGGGVATFSGLLDAPPIDVAVGAAGSTSGNHYGGQTNVASLGPGATFRADGSFFDGSTRGDARATAGALSVTSPLGGVQAAGVFWGER